MNYLYRLGFLPIVGLISSVIFLVQNSNQFSLDHHSYFRVANCYSTGVKAGGVVYSRAALISCVNITNLSVQQTVPGDQTSGPRNLIDPVQCTGSPTYFCCATVTPSPTAPEVTTPTGLTAGKYKVIEVYCWNPKG